MADLATASADADSAAIARRSARRARIDARRNERDSGPRQPTPPATPVHEYTEAHGHARQAQQRVAGLVDELVQEGKRVSEASRTFQHAPQIDSRAELAREREASEVARAAFDVRWAEVSSTAPEDTAAQLVLLHDWCTKALAAKDSALDALAGQLRERDDAYLASVRVHRAEVDEFFVRMRAAIVGLRKRCDEELSQTEAAFLRSRDALLKLQAAQVDALVAERTAQEGALLEQRLAKVDGYEKALTRAHQEAVDRFVRERARLEAEADVREQQMERIRAVYQLNTQKLDYNYTALAERDMEANHTIAQQKRKVARLQDALSGVIARHTRAEAKHRGVNKELTQSYKRAIEQYAELQTKYRHFERAEGATYRRLWAHYEQQLGAKLEALASADRLIANQLLGLAPVCSPPQPEPVEASGDMGASAAAAESALDACELGRDKAEALLTRMAATVPLLSRESLLTALADAGIGQQVRASDVAPVQRVMLTLGIGDASRLDALLSQAVDGDGALLGRDQLVQVLRDFVAGSGDVSSERASLRVRRSSPDLAFWDRVAHSMPETRLRTWALLAKALDKHSDILRERAKLVDTNDTLAQQNRELRQLLAQYLRSGAGATLLHPPVALQGRG